MKQPRPRHQENLGEVRLKTDPRWEEFHNAKSIGGFGVPWGPYGFNSGVTQEDVGKAEARKLGLDVDSVAPKPAKLTDGTQASTKWMDPALKRKLLAELRGGPKPRDAAEAGRQAGERARRGAFERAIERAEERGDAGESRKLRERLAKENLLDQGLAVMDEGERIWLSEDIGERISKLRKRGEPATPEHEKAIAEAVFEWIDRKAAESTTRASGGKGVMRERQLFAKELT